MDSGQLRDLTHISTLFTGLMLPCLKEVSMYANYVRPYRYSKVTPKGYVMMALICVLIASTMGA